MPAELTYRATTVAARAAFRALRLDVHCEGAELVPREGPAILVANHASYLDFLFLGVPAHERGRRPRFLCREVMWHTPAAWPLDRMGHVPVDRDAPAAAYLRARELLRRGEVVGLFPEAGISYSYTVRGLMRGAAALARDTGAPLVVGGLWGAQRIWTVGRTPWGAEPPPDFSRRGRRVDIRLDTTLRVAPDADLTATTVDLGHRLTAVLEELQTRPHHRPRPGEHAPWYPAHLGGDALTPEQARELDLLPRSAVRPVWRPRG
ncbi:1-acyl-sn-glycerol-3-phosphate acyltransferase [Nocardioides sp. ChNu-153]|uniref:lysophospholipid acyltransferase family protein n=1 Tax=unclassified Nocardioides TaxID=2615069 RepID=UPI002405CDC9|nr:MULTISPECIES: lysophospholipid acyltransferase family protein [unclassified Nocardioides]MDF9714536.1 1-acyl-sn-glycerol-3-phosphate acyltransferase [Nocardioides sp. ChNu-99]MDN7119931.1 1-acyl-sn-glycerol-3-phosphate acyltransferase [Nocardioides sp. ChNu-153]